MDGLGSLGAGVVALVVIGAALVTRKMFDRHLPSRTPGSKRDDLLTHDDGQVSDALKNDLERHRLAISSRTSTAVFAVQNGIVA